MRTKNINSVFIHILILFFLGFSHLSYANSGSKEASAGAGNTAKLDTFVVNLSSTERFLQVAMTLQVGSSEVAEQIKLFMPVVRHGLILILSSKEDSQIQSAGGKRELLDEMREKLNKVLKATEHHGITDIFFENFVIQ